MIILESNSICEAWKVTGSIIERVETASKTIVVELCAGKTLSVVICNMLEVAVKRFWK